MFNTRESIDAARRYLAKTGLCPVCKKETAVLGVTCLNETCMSSWITGRPDPCLGLTMYGIQDYECDIVIHVCYNTNELFAYKPEDAICAISSGVHRRRAAYQYVNGKKMRTAGGYAIPMGDIPATGFDIPVDIMGRHKIIDHMNTSAKGRAATSIVIECHDRGILSSLSSVEVTDYRAQLAGIDIATSNAIGTIQSKCDLPGGSKERGGTGNLFVQVCESNPEGRH